MKRATLTVALLLCCAANLAAAPVVLEIRDPVFQGNSFTFDLAITNLGDIDGLGLVAGAAGAILSGPGTAHLTQLPEQMRMSGPEWQTELAASGKNSVWADFVDDEDSNSGRFVWPDWDSVPRYGPADGSMLTFGIVNDPRFTAPADVDDVMVRFKYEWDGVLSPADWFTINICGDGAFAADGTINNPAPYFIAGMVSDWQLIEGSVWNDGYGLPQVGLLVSNSGMIVAVPEPATLSLLAVGLSALILRRRTWM